MNAKDQKSLATLLQIGVEQGLITAEVATKAQTNARNNRRIDTLVRRSKTMEKRVDNLATRFIALNATYEAISNASTHLKLLNKAFATGLAEAQDYADTIMTSVETLTASEVDTTDDEADDAKATTDENPQPKWLGDTKCNICDADCDGELYDAKTHMGPWATMCRKCYPKYGLGLGTGKGQRYLSTQRGRYIKVEG
jgi:hypothetical protein